eukprot:365387-Chlamydomonas_euryale.AAC.7
MGLEVWSAGHAPRGGKGLCARFSCPGWWDGVGMGWLRTVRNGVPFVTASYPLLDPLCLATLNTGIALVGPLLETIILTLYGRCTFNATFCMCVWSRKPPAHSTLPDGDPCTYTRALTAYWP